MAEFDAARQAPDAHRRDGGRIGSTVLIALPLLAAIGLGAFVYLNGQDDPSATDGAQPTTGVVSDVNNAGTQAVEGADAWLTDPVDRNAPMADEVMGRLPDGSADADVWGPVPTPRLAELDRRLTESVAADPDWWLAHVAAAPPGEPVAYDPKLGLTEAEFQEYLTLADEIEFDAVDSAVVMVTTLPDGSKELRISNASGQIDPIVIDAGTLELTSAWGTTPPPTDWTADVADSPLGLAEGWEWEVLPEGVNGATAPSEFSGTRVTVTLARVERDRRTYLRIQGSDFGAGETLDLALLIPARG